MRLAVAILIRPMPLWARILKAEMDRMRNGVLYMRRVDMSCPRGVVNIFLYRPTLAEVASASPPVRRMFQALAVMPRPIYQAETQISPGSCSDTQSQLLSAWGWQTPDGFIPISQLTVKVATELLVAEQFAARRHKHETFCHQACSMTNAVMASDKQLEKLLQEIWQTPCGNSIKETFWRLVLDGLPTAARRHANNEMCACGSLNPDRAHHFWVCPVASSIIANVQRQLDAFLSATGRPSLQLAARHIWLCEIPRGVQPWLWRTVCMAAVSAMDFGRSFMASQMLSRRSSGSVLIDLASRNSGARFWDLLAEVAASRKLPRPSGVSAVQPFLRFCGSWDVTRVP